MRLSVLQLWSAAQTVTIAPALDRLGYHRFRLSEHHGESAHSATPFLLSAVVAGMTSRLRTGPAGVLLHYPSPLHVADNARAYARIDVSRPH